MSEKKHKKDKKDTKKKSHDDDEIMENTDGTTTGASLTIGIETETNDEIFDFEIAPRDRVPEDFLELVMTQVRDVLIDKLYNDYLVKFQKTSEFRDDKSRRFEPEEIMAREGPEERKIAQVKSNLIYHYIYDQTSPGYFLFQHFLRSENAQDLTWCVGVFNQMEHYAHDKELFLISLNGVLPAVKTLKEVDAISPETFETIEEFFDSKGEDSGFLIASKDCVPQEFFSLVMTEARDVLTDELYNDYLVKFQKTSEFKDDKSRRFEPEEIMAREGPEERKEAQVKSNLIYHYIYDKTSPGYFLFFGFLSTENALNLAWCVSTFNEMEQYENDKELFMILLNGIWPAVKEKVNSLSPETIEKIEHGMKSVNSGSSDDPDTPDDDDGKSSGQDPSRAGKKADKKSSKDDKKSGKGDKKSSKKSK